MKNTTTLFFLAATTFIINNASAKQGNDKTDNGPWYARVDGGTSIAASRLDSIDYDRKRPLRSAFYGVGLGYNINSDFRTDITVSHRVNYRLSVHSKNSDNDDIVIAQNFNSTAVMANLYYTLFQKSIFCPYLNVGFGFSRNNSMRYSQNIVDANNGDILFKKIAPSKNKLNLAYSIGGGISTKLNKKFNFDLNYKYIDLGNLSRARYTETISNQQYSSSPGRLTAHEFGIGITYNI